MDQESLYVNLVSVFTSDMSGFASSNPMTGAHLDNHNVILGYLVSDVKEDNVEIPVHAVDILANSILNEHSFNHKFDQIAFPLCRIRSTISVKTSSSLISKAVVQNFMGRLLEFRTSSEETYYGCEGLILDKNLDPILLATVDVDKAESDEEETFLRVKSFNVRISPKVFDRDTALSKYLINKLIPLYLSRKIRDVDVMGSICIDSEGITPRIIVEDSNKFIVKAEAPESVDFDKNMAVFLKKKSVIDEIINAI